MTDIAKMDTFIASLGAEAYRVGGSVRDELIDREPKDADYMVRGMTIVELSYALVSRTRGRGEVKALQLRDGRQAGFRIKVGGIGAAEIVLPRCEISTGPGHRDFDIIVDPDIPLDEDARRRDFTFNALYKRVSDEGTSLAVFDGGKVLENIQDPTGRGLYDLSRRMINTTHEDSFRDDPLRILRALRFVAKGYTLGANTELQMRRYASSVNGLSAAGYTSGTVLEEMNKILMGTEAVKALRLARDTGVLEVLIPELAPMLGFKQNSRYHDMTADEHTFVALATAVKMNAPLRVRWALLFHDSGKPATAWMGTDSRLHYYVDEDPTHVAIAAKVNKDHADHGADIWLAFAKRLNIGSLLRDPVEKLIRAHMLDVTSVRPSKVRRMRVQFGDDLLEDLIMHRACDFSGKGKINQGQFDALARMREIQVRAMKEKVPTKPTDLKVNGHDLIDLGLKGNDIGRVQRELLHEVVSDPRELKLSREWQLTAAKRLA